MRVYLDTCVFSRRFQDQNNPRVRREAFVAGDVMRLISAGWLVFVGSDILALELRLTRNPVLRHHLLNSVPLAQRWIAFDTRTVWRAAELHARGIGRFDALHVAAAEAGNCRLLLTVDRKFIRACHNGRVTLNVRVAHATEIYSYFPELPPPPGIDSG